MIDEALSCLVMVVTVDRFIRQCTVAALCWKHSGGIVLPTRQTLNAVVYRDENTSKEKQMTAGDTSRPETTSAPNS